MTPTNTEMPDGFKTILRGSMWERAKKELNITEEEMSKNYMKDEEIIESINLKMDEKNRMQSEFVKSLLELYPIVENSEGRIDTANNDVQWILETIKIEDEELKLVDQHRLWVRLENGNFALLDAPQDFLHKLKHKTQ